jgi:hypothetical protein
MALSYYEASPNPVVDNAKGFGINISNIIHFRVLLGGPQAIAFRLNLTSKKPNLPLKRKGVSNFFAWLTRKPFLGLL